MSRLSVQSIVLPFALSISSTLANASDFIGLDHFPLQQNPVYTYLDNIAPTTEVYTVHPGTTTINSAATKRLEYNTGENEYYSNDAAGIFIHRIDFPEPGIGTITATMNPPAKLAEAVMSVGQTTNDNTNVSYQIPGYGNFNLDFAQSTTIESVEAVSVPLGTFTATKVLVTQTLSGTILGSPVNETTQTRFWFVKHIGPVKVHYLSDGEIAELTAVDSDGDGLINALDTDDDNDGVDDTLDAFPLDPDESVDTDNDGIGNNEDPDDDGDLVNDIDDSFPLDPNEQFDNDLDGIGDNADMDDDNDQIPDDYELANGLNPLVDDAGLDLDNDGWSNLEEYQNGTQSNDPASFPGAGSTEVPVPWAFLLLQSLLLCYLATGWRLH